VPPFVGVAVKVTDVPAHIAPEGTAAILTLTGRIGLTVIVIPLEVTGLPDVHPSEDVITTVTTLPLARPEVVYVESPPPTLFPFNFH
jgi:hypothetical protein